MSVVNLSDYRRRAAPRVTPDDFPVLVPSNDKTPHLIPLPSGRGGEFLPEGLGFRLVVEIGLDGAVAADWDVAMDDGPFAPGMLQRAAAAVMAAQGEIARAAELQGLGARIVSVLARVCEQHGVTLAQLKGRQRTRHIVEARRAAARALRQLTRPDGRTALSLPRIGAILGGRDHSTVHHLIHRGPLKGGYVMSRVAFFRQKYALPTPPPANPPNTGSSGSRDESRNTLPREFERREMLERIADLTEQVAYWKRLATGSDLIAPAGWGLTPCETFLAGQLARRGMIRRDTVAEMWPGPKGAEISTKNIDVYVWRLRRKLRPAGVVIATARGLGWRVDDATRARMMAAMGGGEG